MYKPWGDHETSRRAPLGRSREVGEGSATIKLASKHHPSGQSCQPQTPDSSQHPVNTVHLGYLLFERCDKQWQPCTINMWAHDWFKLHNCWICPESLSRVVPKCTLTENKPLLVTKGAALGGHGLCQTCRRVEVGKGQTPKGQWWGGDGEWGTLAAFSALIAFE